MCNLKVTENETTNSDKIVKGQYNAVSYHLGCSVFHFYTGIVA